MRTWTKHGQDTQNQHIILMNKKSTQLRKQRNCVLFVWLREQDLNLRPSGYEGEYMAILNSGDFDQSRVIGDLQENTVANLC